MQDGEFEGLGEGRSGMIKVAIIVKNHIITAIKSTAIDASMGIQQGDFTYYPCML